MRSYIQNGRTVYPFICKNCSRRTTTTKTKTARMSVCNTCVNQEVKYPVFDLKISLIEDVADELGYTPLLDFIDVGRVADEVREELSLLLPDSPVVKSAISKAIIRQRHECRLKGVDIRP